jgi:hypothetical protein
MRIIIYLSIAMQLKLQNNHTKAPRGRSEIPCGGRKIPCGNRKKPHVLKEKGCSKKF